MDDTVTQDDRPRLEIAQSLLPPGTHIGRYEVRRFMGAGAMGVVYEAFDPELDRRIALKLLTPQPGRESAAHRKRERMLREATALAQLSHPNVVAVFDVGTTDDRVFIAMELVEGQTLGQWATQAERSYRDILRVALPAGDGLSAAHAAGIVHRDVKPANIIVGAGEKVRVIDFGLAKATSDSSDRSRASSESGTKAGVVAALAGAAAALGSSQSAANGNGSGHGFMSIPPIALRSKLTADGAVLGTPLYMSPEQHLGAIADERSDQFSFCVSLYELLTGNAPFVAKTLAGKLQAIKDGRVQPGTRPIPKWLRRVLLRGLSYFPADRYESMDALLKALRYDPRARLTKLAFASAVGVSLALGVYGTMREHPADRCARGASQASEMWQADAQKRTRAAFERSGSPRAGEGFIAFSRMFSQFESRWSEQYREACEATFLNGAQSESMLDARMACLDRRRNQAKEVIELLARDPKMGSLDRAPEAMSQLSDLGACENGANLMSQNSQLPSDEQARATVHALERRLDRARALAATGQHQEALDAAKAVQAEALPGNYLPLINEAGLAVADEHDALGEHEAAEAAAMAVVAQSADARMLSGMAEGHLRLLRTLGARKAKFDEAHRLAATTRGLIALSGNEAAARLKYEKLLGATLKLEGDDDEALTHFEQALALAREVHGPRSIQSGKMLSNIAAVLSTMGKQEAALEHMRESLDILSDALGPNHPALVTILGNLGALCLSLDLHEEGERHLTDALRVGKGTPSEAHAALNLGRMQLNAGRYQKAATHLDLAEASWRRTFGDAHPKVAIALGAQAALAFGRSDYDRAAEQYRAAIHIFRSTGLSESSQVTDWLREGALSAMHAGRTEEAVRLAEEARSQIASSAQVPGALIATLADVHRELSMSKAVTHAQSALRDCDIGLDQCRLPRVRAMLVLAEVTLAQGNRVEATALRQTALRTLAVDKTPEGRELARRLKTAQP